MPSVRIWALESDYDQRAVQCLAEKLVAYSGQTVTVYRGADKSALSTIGASQEALRRAVASYLKRDAGVIFVLDTDSPATQAAHARQRHSWLNRVKQICQYKEFAGRVFLVEAKQEIEAWLLVDCLGIACYFARDRYPADGRSKLKKDAKFVKLINKHQAGDTELIVEALPGGAGPKEALIKFSQEILKALNPNLKPADVDSRCYSEKLSPEVARHIEISAATVKRNRSLQKMGDTIVKCASKA